MILSDSGGTTFEQPPTGSHSARCISIIDIGTQRSTYEGEVQVKHQLVIRWELSNELMTSGEFTGTKKQDCAKTYPYGVGATLPRKS